MSSLLADLTEKYAAARVKNRQLCNSVRELNESIYPLQDQIRQLSQELEALVKSREEALSEQEKLAASIAEMKTCIEALLPPPPPPAPSGQVWRVSDNHSHCSTGAWALEATESGHYSVCVTPTKKAKTDKAIMEVTLLDGSTATVSKRRLKDTEGIKIGDTLYMGDAKRQKVYKGKVTGQSVKGLFRAADPSFNSMRRRVGEREAQMRKTSTAFYPLDTEIEVMWEVSWEEQGPLNEDWKNYLQFSLIKTVVPLPPHLLPPA